MEAVNTSRPVREHQHPDADYLSAPVGPYQVRIFLPGYEQVDALSIHWDVLRKRPNQKVFHVAKVSSVRTVVGYDFVRGDGKTVKIYVKRGVVSGFLARVEAMFRASKEWREMVVANRFAKRGVWVPRPVYYAEALSEDREPLRFLATLALEENWSSAKRFFRTHRTFDREWRSLAHFLRRLHETGLHHADFRADHLFFDATRVGVWDDLSSWALIDLDGAHADGSVSAPQRRRAVKQLTESLLSSGLEKEHLKEFVSIYDPQNEAGLDVGQIFKAAEKKHTRRKVEKEQEAEQEQRG